MHNIATCICPDWFCLQMLNACSLSECLCYFMHKLSAPISVGKNCCQRNDELLHTQVYTNKGGNLGFLSELWHHEEFIVALKMSARFYWCHLKISMRDKKKKGFFLYLAYFLWCMICWVHACVVTYQQIVRYSNIMIRNWLTK